MHMGRKGALVVIAVLALWAAQPALACLMTAAPMPCCRGAMRGCPDAAPTAAMACCHPSPENAVPPAVAPGALSTWTAHPGLGPMDVPALQQSHRAALRRIDAAPSPPPPGYSSILRI